MRLDGADDVDLCRAEATAVRVDDGLGDVADLEMAVLGEAYQQGPGALRGNRKALGEQSRRHSDLLPPGQCVLELGDLSFQLRHPRASLQALKDEAHLRQRRLRDHASPR